jgi:hypothetical protein
MRNILLVVFLAIPLTQSCAALLGIGAGVLITQEMLDNQTYVARLELGSERLWPSAKTTLSHLSLKPVDVDDDLRVCIADIDQSKVTVAVETYDLNQSILRVRAEKFGVANGELAKMVLDKILDDLDR